MACINIRTTHWQRAFPSTSGYHYCACLEGRTSIGVALATTASAGPHIAKKGDLMYRETTARDGLVEGRDRREYFVRPRRGCSSGGRDSTYVIAARTTCSRGCAYSGVRARPSCVVDVFGETRPPRAGVSGPPEVAPCRRYIYVVYEWVGGLR